MNFFTRSILSIPYRLLFVISKVYFNQTDEIKSVYLTGSFARKDFLYGKSDIDFILLCDCSENVFQKLQLRHYRWAKTLVFFGKPADVKSNTVLLNQFRVESEYSNQKINLKHLQSELFYGEPVLDKIETCSIDYIQFIESLIIHLFLSLMKENGYKEILDKKMLILNQILATEEFSKSCKSKVKNIENVSNLHSFIETLKANNSEYEKLTLPQDIDSFSWEMGRYVDAEKFDYPIMVKQKTVPHFYFQDTNDLLEITKKYNLKNIGRTECVIWFKDFVLYSLSEGIRVIHKERLPFLWGESSINKDSFEFLNHKINSYESFCEEWIYKPFFENNTEEMNYLKSVNDKRVCSDAARFALYKTIVSTNLVNLTIENDYYTSLLELKKVFKFNQELVKPTISLCICTKNREALLVKLLKSISDQIDRPDEIIIVNNNSVDNTLDVLNKFKDDLCLTIINSNLPTINALRDLCVKEASMDVVAFTDDDAVLEENWIYHIRKSYEADEHLMLLGGQMIHWKQDLLNSSELFHRYYLGRRM
jgi:predicted nucleotidyltransferase